MSSEFILSGLAQNSSPNNRIKALSLSMDQGNISELILIYSVKFTPNDIVTIYGPSIYSLLFMQNTPHCPMIIWTT